MCIRDSLSNLHAVEDIVLPILSFKLNAKSLLLGSRLDQLEHLMVFVGGTNTLPRLGEFQATVLQTDYDNLTPLTYKLGGHSAHGHMKVTNERSLVSRG